tara:strand:- start:736 stop:1035 length:300 start_codon:yes stop_codon:yes gene_type:complete
MSWKKVIVRTIPNTETPFEQMSDSVKAYAKTNYIDTGKFSSNITTSDDGLVITYTNIFPDEASKNEYESDSTIANEANRRNTINENNGITKEVTMNEEI